MTDELNAAGINQTPNANAGDNQTQAPSSIFGEWSEKAGVGDKYASVEDLAKGKVHADEHINKLAEELANTKEVISELVANQKQTVSAESVLEEIKQLQSEKGNTNPNISDADLESKIASIFDKRTEAQKSNDNKAQANALMHKTFGDNATEVFKKKAESMGVNPEFLMGVAEKSPKAFAELMGVTSKIEAPANPSQGSINAINLTNKQAEPGSVDEFKNHMKEQGVKRGSLKYYEALEKKFGSNMKTIT